VLYAPGPGVPFLAYLKRTSFGNSWLRNVVGIRRIYTGDLAKHVHVLREGVDGRIAFERKAGICAAPPRS
jgi:hypothetical protein